MHVRILGTTLWLQLLTLSKFVLLNVGVMKCVTYGKSRDVVTSLEARVSRLKSNLDTLGEHVDNLDGRCD
ncbi:hypothetical protein PanWU01x14_016970, partial [Parasponia andersonii]